ncbi:MAG: hypothetical protein BGO53_12735 [Sphingobacteriales bacterium 39-19]|nr:MAG: hypothetical protein BGO53_12735 [Sphingobacteriales bacterium 39-19]
MAVSAEALLCIVEESCNIISLPASASDDFDLHATKIALIVNSSNSFFIFFRFYFAVISVKIVPQFLIYSFILILFYMNLYKQGIN